MNRAERIFKLHQRLKRKTPSSMEQLRDVLHASRATINRDIEYMRNFMEAPVLYDRERGGYRYDPAAPEFELPGLWFNASELYALLATEQLLINIQPGLLSPYIGPLKARIRQLLQQSGHAADTVTERIRLQPFAQRLVDPEYFGTVAGSVLNGRKLEIDYHGRERNERTKRRINPYRLLHYRDNWYLAAYCERAKGLRTFSLDRISAATESDDRIKPVSEAELDRYIGASFGIFTGEAKAWAVLRFNSARAQWVADETWHPDQIGHWQGEAYELQVPYADPRELVMDILKYGPDVEVVAPEELREQVATRLQEAAAQYRERNE